jgi:aspartate/methionine/tyrosine aminotransferase
LEKNPDAKIISLGIGDTTQPIPEAIWKGMADAAAALGTPEGYSGCVQSPRTIPSPAATACACGTR